MPELQPTEKSTTVRPGSGVAKHIAARKRAIARLRVAVTWVQRVSPDLAARGLERVFLSPQRHERPAHEREAFASARRRELTYRGKRVPMYGWGARGRPVVMFAHGWEGRATQVAPYLAPLLAAGFQVISYDTPGHGEADDALVSVLDFAALAEHVASSLREPVQAAIGHSAGAAALILAASRTPFTDRIVAVSPPLRPGAFLKQFAGWLSASSATERALLQRLHVRYARPFDEIDSRKSLERVSAQGLVIHDRGDADVPFAHGEEIAAAWPGATLMATEGLGHRRILRDAEVVRAVLSFVGPPSSTPSLESQIAADLYDPAQRRYERA